MVSPLPYGERLTVQHGPLGAGRQPHAGGRRGGERLRVSGPAVVGGGVRPASGGERHRVRAQAATAAAASSASGGTTRSRGCERWTCAMVMDYDFTLLGEIPSPAVADDPAGVLRRGQLQADAGPGAGGLRAAGAGPGAVSGGAGATWRWLVSRVSSSGAAAHGGRHAAQGAGEAAHLRAAAGHGRGVQPVRLRPVHRRCGERLPALRGQQPDRAGGRGAGDAAARAGARTCTAGRSCRGRRGLSG